MDEVGEESVVGRILYKMSELHNKDVIIKKYYTKSFPEKFHPRRHQLYRSFTPNNDMFFNLRSQGVPVLTAYFLCEPGNITRLHRQLQEKYGLEIEDALAIIKNI
jgi:hypothetical protein